MLYQKMGRPSIIYTVYLYLSALLQSLRLCMYYMCLYFSVHLFRAVGHICRDCCSRSPYLVPCGGKWLGIFFYYIVCMSNVSISKEKWYPNQWGLDHSIKGSILLWDFVIILIQLMYIVFVFFDWTRAQSPVWFWIVQL